MKNVRIIQRRRFRDFILCSSKDQTGESGNRNHEMRVFCSKMYFKGVLCTTKKKVLKLVTTRQGRRMSRSGYKVRKGWVDLSKVYRKLSVEFITQKFF